MSDCQACALPRMYDASMNAFIWLPQGHTQTKLSHYLGDKDYDFEPLTGANCLRVRVPDTGRFIVQLTGLLTRPEQTDTRMLLTHSDEPGLAEFGQVMTVAETGGRLRGQWLIELLDEGRYHSVAQPIVEAGSERVFGYEFLFRGTDRDGSPVSPKALFESAADPRIFFNLDRQARLSAVETAARGLTDEAVFINFMPGSVYDPTVCLRTTVNAIDRHGIDPHRVVFEIVESDKFDDLAHLNGIIQFYRKAGFRVALDDFGAGFNNISTFLGLRPNFIKLDKYIIDQVMTNEQMRDLIHSFIDQAGSVGCLVLAEGVETEACRDLLREMKVDYMQGYLFGRPAPLERAVEAAVS